jgi:predicted permease
MVGSLCLALFHLLHGRMDAKRGLRKILGDVGAREVAVYMVLKLLVVPLIMVGLVQAMPLDDEARHIAVLISSFPIALLSFPVGVQYSTGETILSANFAAATLLLLPSLFLWEFALNAFGLFPLDTAS